MELVRVALTDPRAEQLLVGLREEYALRYGPGGGADDVSPTVFDAPTGAFLVLMDGETTIAGGGFCRYDDQTCEFKRVWTHADYRRQGHAKVILRELEKIALERGYRTVRLETGDAQPEALALYPSLGFEEIGTYGHYPNATGFERPLTVA